MNAYRELIGETDISRVFLENDRGLRAELLSLGACIRKIDAFISGNWLTLTQSFADLNEYTVRNTAYAGKTLGPCAGRFTVKAGIQLDDGSVFHPDPNERGINCLHGGEHSLSRMNWLVTEVKAGENSASAVFSAGQADGLDGWPGKRDYLVTYTLRNDDSLEAVLEAQSDIPTYMNMSNHSYWNLNIRSGEAMEQFIQIFAEGMAMNSPVTGVPCEAVPLSVIERENGIRFDRENTIREISPKDSGTDYAKQILLGKGQNNAFLFGEQTAGTVSHRCSLLSSDRKIRVDMFSDAPAMVLYASGSMDEGLALENGQTSRKNCSAALEFQEMPTIQKITTLHPGEKFSRTIRFCFSF